MQPFPSLLGKVARSAGWGVARFFDRGRIAQPSPQTFDEPYLLSAPHPALRATFPASRRRGARRAVDERRRTSRSSRPARCALNAGMGPFPGAPDQSRGRRIERHIARRRHQMVLVGGDRTEPPLAITPSRSRSVRLCYKNARSVTSGQLCLPRNIDRGRGRASTARPFSRVDSRAARVDGMELMRHADQAAAVSSSGSRNGGRRPCVDIATASLRNSTLKGISIVRPLTESIARNRHLVASAEL